MLHHFIELACFLGLGTGQGTSTMRQRRDKGVGRKISRVGAGKG